MSSPDLHATSRYVSDGYLKGLKRRRRSELWLKRLGLAAIAIAILLLVTLFATIGWQSHTAFKQTRIALPITFSKEVITPGQGDIDAQINAADYRSLIRQGLYEVLGRPETRDGRREIGALVSEYAVLQLRDYVNNNRQVIGNSIPKVWLPASDDIDNVVQELVSPDVPESDRRLNNRQLGWLTQLQEQDRVQVVWNTDLFLRNDSREPEVAGILGGVVGSALMLIVTLAVSLPLGVAAAIYLEEFAPKNWFTELIDINIRNLAAVPSIVFGLLALAIFIRLFDMPRGSPLVGGLALSLLTLPTIIIAARAAIQAVPSSLRDAALELGASHMQAVTRVVIPNALPGILTGTIISVAEALGETAPLLMIGMVAFIVDTPKGFTDSAAPLPVQIYTWSTSPELAFASKTAAAIIVLLVMLLIMNGLAIYLRNRFQRSW